MNPGEIEAGRTSAQWTTKFHYCLIYWGLQHLRKRLAGGRTTEMTRLFPCKPAAGYFPRSGRTLRWPSPRSCLLPSILLGLVHTKNQPCQNILQNIDLNPSLVILWHLIRRDREKGRAGGKRKGKRSGKRDNNYVSMNFHTKNGITFEGILSAHRRDGVLK